MNAASERPLAGTPAHPLVQVVKDKLMPLALVPWAHHRITGRRSAAS